MACRRATGPFTRTTLPLHAYLAHDRRQALARDEPLPERCSGAALFADITGFTALTEALAQGQGSRRGVDDLVRRINAVHEVLIGAVERAGGSVVSLAGDGMTCWFDDRHASGEPAARRALRCAGAMQQAMRPQPELSVKVGLAAGAAMRLAVGDPALQLLDLLAGATVARAVAAESQALAGEVLVDGSIVAPLSGPLAAPGTAHGLGAPRQTALGDPVYPYQVGADDDATAASASSGAPVAAPSAAGSLPPAGRPTDADLLRPWLLPFVFERLMSSVGLFATALRPATALFVRVALGTGPVETPAGADRDALQALVVAVQRVLQHHGGVLLEASVDARGTCLYGNFGAAQVHEDDPSRALRAALELRQRFDDDGLELQIGLSSGTLCVGGYGGPTRRSFGAIGNEVNSAARLMALARPGEILLSGRTRQLLPDDDFAFEARAPVPLKGKTEPMAVFAAAGLQQRRAIRLQEPPAVLPLVGRSAEVAQLQAALAAARQGHGQVLRIVAEAGMGKSRLLAEGVRLARRSGFIGYGGASRLDGVLTPYLIWQGVWRAFFDLDPALPQRRQRQAVQAVLQRDVPEHAEAGPLLAAVLALDWPDTPFTAALLPRDRKALLEAVLLRCLQAAAADMAEDGMGLLLVLEDLHAADPPSVDLLLALARGSEALPVLVLSAERPPEPTGIDDTRPRADWPPHTQHIVLSGLTSTDVEAMARSTLARLYPERPGTLPAAVLEQLVRRAQGNPFYVEELLAFLHDRGLDPQHPDAVLALEAPSSLHSLVLSRMDRLPALQQNVLKAASVVGREFTLADLQGYCPTLGPPDAVATAVVELGRLGLTPPLPDATEPTHVFHHLVTHEVAYESIGHDTRAVLHEQFARHLERRHADPEAWATQLAHHYERAGCAGPASHYLRRAASQAMARYANDEALSHLERALRCLPAAEAAGRFELLMQRQALSDLQGRHDAQRADLDELQRLATLLPGASARRIRLLGLQAQLELDVGRHAEAQAQLAAALAQLDAATPHDGSLSALRPDLLLLQAQVLLHAGHAAAALQVVDAALALSQGEPALRLKALSRSGQAHWQLGDLALAGQRFAQALDLARQGSDLRAQLNVLNSLGVVAKSRSRFAEAARHYDDALALARRIGDRSGEAMLLNNLGSACLAAGRFHEAALHCEQAVRMFAEAGEAVMHGLALTNCAEARREAGRPLLALQLSAQALDRVRSGGSRGGEALVLENLALAEAAVERPDDAQAHLLAAIELARAMAAPAREASALLNLGRLHLDRGDGTAAGAALDQVDKLALRLCDPSLDTGLQAAHARLRVLQGSPAEAAQSLQPLLDTLLVAPDPDLPAPSLDLYASALQVLQAAGDARAAALRQRARQVLAERAAHFPDAAAQRNFLAMAPHRAIQAD